MAVAHLVSGERDGEMIVSDILWPRYRAYVEGWASTWLVHSREHMELFGQHLFLK